MHGLSCWEQRSHHGLSVDSCWTSQDGKEISFSLQQQRVHVIVNPIMLLLVLPSTNDWKKWLQTHRAVFRLDYLFYWFMLPSSTKKILAKWILKSKFIPQLKQKALFWKKMKSCLNMMRIVAYYFSWMLQWNLNLWSKAYRIKGLG